MLFIIQVIYGAFTSGLNAGELWNTFPLMEGKIIPDDLFEMSPGWVNIFEHNKFVQFFHRYMSILILFLIYLFCYKFNKENKNLEFNIKNLIVIVTIQFMLGILTLITKSSMIIVLCHQFNAILLMLAIIKTKHSIKYI